MEGGQGGGRRIRSSRSPMQLYGHTESEANLAQTVEGVFVKVCTQSVWHVVGLCDSDYCIMKDLE